MLLSFFVYNANLRLVGTGDSYSARVSPFALISEGTLNLDDFKPETFQIEPLPYWLQPTLDGHVASLFPVVTPVLVTPLYLPVVAYLKATGWTNDRLKIWTIIMEKFSASFITALAVGFMYLALRRRGTERTAILLTCAFAFATGTWSTSSQALWLHGPAELLIALSLWLVTGSVGTARALLAGAAIALIAWNRPPDVFIGAAIGLPALVWARWKAPWLILAAAAASGAVVTYNITAFGHVLGAWSGVGSGSLGGHFLDGLRGILVSGARGLFVFDPFLLTLPLGLYWIVRCPNDRLLSLVVGIGVVIEILFYAMTPFWGAGASYGPRYMVDLMPAMIWLLVPVIERLQTVGRLAFTALMMFSVWVEYVGAFTYTGESNILYYATSATEFDPAPFFDLRNTQYLLESKHPRQPASLVPAIESAF